MGEKWVLKSDSTFSRCKFAVLAVLLKFSSVGTSGRPLSPDELQTERRDCDVRRQTEGPTGPPCSHSYDLLGMTGPGIGLPSDTVIPFTF